MSPPIDIARSLLEEVLPDTVQLLGAGERVVRELLHVGLDELILRVGGEDVVDEALVVRPEGGATAAAAWTTTIM